MKSILFIVIATMILARAHWYIYTKGVKNNWLRYSVFSVVSSIILTILQMNIGDFLDDLVSGSAIFTAYMIIFIFYPVVRDKINSLS